MKNIWNSLKGFKGIEDPSELVLYIEIHSFKMPKNFCNKGS